MKTLHWFREDLRLLDNLALDYAANSGPVAAAFIYPKGLGGASYWWLHHSLKSLSKSLKEKGIELILKTGEPHKILPALAAGMAAEAVTWNRVYSPQGVDHGQAVKDALDAAQIKHRSFNSQLLIEPTKVMTKQGTPFKVFTPFWRNCTGFLNPPQVLPEPHFEALNHSIKSEQLDDWALLPSKPNWAEGFDQYWEPGEQGAQQRWQIFLDGAINRYSDGRDIPSESNTSLLSPHLAFGEIGAKQLWHDTHNAINAGTADSDNGRKFLSEIGWREFSRYLLIHFPHLERRPFNAKFEHFPWGDHSNLVTAWQQGKTGYPIVDAGMRELWQTGYMHNRVRMIVASFLTKHCISHWHYGMDWFWDTLLDADIGNNTASWQWAAGCGADAAPYFRIFNPILQGEKFDKEGVYIKKWVPELAELPRKYINKPWEADGMTLKLANITLGEDYPYPVVDHKEARERALSAFQVLKEIQ